MLPSLDAIISPSGFSVHPNLVHLEIERSFEMIVTFLATTIFVGSGLSSPPARAARQAARRRRKRQPQAGALCRRQR